MVILIIAMVVILGLGVYIILNSKKPKNKQKAKQSIMYIKIYNFLSAFFLTQSKAMKIYGRLAAMSVYNRNELCMLTTKFFIVSSGLSTGLIVVSVMLFKDTLSILICVLFAFVMDTILVDKQIDKTNTIVLMQFRRAISAIREEYLKLGSVPEAIANAEYGAVVKRPMDEIHTILTTSNGELKLHEFYESTPFRPIQTLAGICYNINNSGDNVDETGQSSFIQALTLLLSDANSEVERYKQQKSVFGYIEYLPLVPVLAIKPTESFFMSIMPGTALIYGGPLGYIIRVVILLVCILSYSVISRVNSVVAIKDDDRKPWTMTMLKNKSWEKFIHNIVPKNSKARKVNASLKASLSRLSIEQLYTQKIVYGAVAFILAIMTAMSTVSLGEEFIRNSTQQLSLIATDEMEKYDKQAILDLDMYYLSLEVEPREEELKSLVMTYMPGLSDLQMFDQYKRLRDKKKSLANAYFKWWYTIVCVLASVMGYLGPNLLLMLRKYLVQTEADNDFLQLQTLVSILMNTNIDTLDVLQQLYQHSRIHKDILLYCYHSYPADPERELTRLQSKTPIMEFKRFIGKLKLTVSDLSLKEAFSDLIIEREHIMKIREMTMKSTLKRKRGLCGPLSMAPLVLFVMGELLVPIGILGINEFSSAMKMM